MLHFSLAQTKPWGILRSLLLFSQISLCLTQSLWLQLGVWCARGSCDTLHWVWMSSNGQKPETSSIFSGHGGPAVLKVKEKKYQKNISILCKVFDIPVATSGWLPIAKFLFFVLEYQEFF